ncbi:MAG: hypothetical protein RM022_021760 [Nostoc sp. EfeVER01]|uniref:hypothetical protein n=1 Tax=Nostoc sp. EfeVER01 TaxID=3075406 RepID=UPI002AD28BE8|nr:hypothetical protein [Nostoc sp. EfeVER01]MDZ7949448.1 hypothetical protein [Nostoc sp. EfeVER01]
MFRLPSLREAALLYETLRERLRSVTTPTIPLLRLRSVQVRVSRSTTRHKAGGTHA